MSRMTIDAPAQTAGTSNGILDTANVIPSGGEETYFGVTYLSALAGHSRRYAEGTDKVFDELPVVTGDPVTIYRGIDTSLLMQSGVGSPEVLRAFNASASFGVEQYTQEVLNGLAVDITPTPGTPVTNIKAALGLLEQYAAERYSGLPLIHANKFATELMTELQVGTDGKLHTVNGTPISNGGGYGVAGPGAITGPDLALGATAAVGGTFAAGTYFWTATALNDTGESIPGTEVSATLVATGTQELTWAAVEGATGYRIWRGTASGAQDTLVATVGTVTTYTDTGAAGTAEVPPTVNTTSDAPAGSAWVYISGQVHIWQEQPEVIEGPSLRENRDLHLAEASYTVAVESFAAAILIGYV